MIATVTNIETGPVLDISAEEVTEPRQSISEALLGTDGNRSEIPNRMAKHHMVLVHMKPESRSCVQTYLMTPVRRTRYTHTSHVCPS